MKKKRLYIFTFLILIIIVVGVAIFVNIRKKKEEDKPIIQNVAFVGIGVSDKQIVEDDNYIFKSYDDFLNKFNEYDKENISIRDFNTSVLTPDDFEKNNYALVKIGFNSCAQSEVRPVGYKIDDNNIHVDVLYRASCGVCAPLKAYYLLPIDKSLESINIDIEEKAVNKISCDQNIAYKPILYFYPEGKTDISVKLLNDEYLTTTYPKYNDSWEVVAYKDGTLVDKKTGRKHYGLYWEGVSHFARMMSDGFVVKGDDTINFLEEKLKILGLNEREANEFIIYWLPKLESNKYNYIRFETNDEINEYMPLEINPVPDTLIRVMMSYKPLDEKIDIKEQILNKQTRKGFTVVEWGGTLIS